MKFFSITLIALWCGLRLTAQPIQSTQRQRDSLERVVQRLPGDTTKVRALLTLSGMYTTADPEVAIKFANQAQTLAQYLGDLQGQLQSLGSIGFLHNITGDWNLGIKTAYQGLAIAGDQAYWQIRFRTAFVLSYDKQGDYIRCVEMALRTVRLIKAHPSSLSAIEAWPLHMLMGKAYARIDKPDSGIYHARIAFELAKHTDDPISGRGYTAGAISNCFVKKNELDSALYFLRQALQIFTATQTKFARQEIMRDLASVFLASHQPDSTFKYAKLAMEESLAIKNPMVTKDALLILSQYFEKRDPVLSLEYIKGYTNLRDSLYSIEKAWQLSRLEFEEQNKVAEVEKAELMARNEIRQNALIGTLGTSALVSLILIYYNRRKQKTNEKLRRQRDEIETQNKLIKATQAQLIQSEKMASLGELTAGIAHEIQNPLNFVNNFSEVNGELIDEMKSELANGNGQQAAQIADTIKENLEKINHHGKRADGIVKGMLQHSRSSTGVKEPTDINALADEYLRLAYHGLRAKDKTFNATMETHFDASLGVINIIPQDMGRALLNLITNAFYAVTEKKKQQPDGYNPTVIVSTKRRDGKVLISVRDNGNGIPQKALDKIFQPFFTTKPTGQGTGLGLSLAYDIITKGHGGSLEVKTEERDFTEFLIHLTRD